MFCTWYNNKKLIDQGSNKILRMKFLDFSLRRWFSHTIYYTETPSIPKQAPPRGLFEEGALKSFVNLSYCSWKCPTHKLLFDVKNRSNRVFSKGYANFSLINDFTYQWLYQWPFGHYPTFSYSDECWTKKAFKYVKRMLPLFPAVVKFCSTNRLFNQWLPFSFLNL